MATASQPTAGLMSTCPQGEVKNPASFRGMTCDFECPSHCWISTPELSLKSVGTKIPQNAEGTSTTYIGPKLFVHWGSNQCYKSILSMVLELILYVLCIVFGSKEIKKVKH